MSEFSGLLIPLEELLAPISDDEPAGPDLGYDPQRQEIEDAFSSSFAGDEDQAPVDWRSIIKLIVGQARQTRDIWLAVYLARAGARAGDLVVVEAGCLYLAGLFEDHWDAMHPMLDELGFQGRKGPCDSLAHVGEFVGPLKRTVLIAHPRLGHYTGQDLDRFAASGDSAEGYGMFRAAIEDLPVEDISQAIDRVDHIRDAIRRIDTVLTAQADGETGTNFAATYEAIEAIRKGLMPFAGLAEADDAASPAGDADDGGDAGSAAAGEPRGGGARIAGRVDSREDVVKAIDAIVDYYRRREPASPVPVVLRRARDWVEMDFLTLLEDIAPDSLSDAKKVLVSQREDSDD